MAPAMLPPAIEEYRLDLDVSFVEGSWTGTVEFDLDTPPRRLTLDATRLEISTIEVNGRPTEFVHRREELDLTVPTGAAPARVRVAFRGQIEPRGMIGMVRV